MTIEQDLLKENQAQRRYIRQLENVVHTVKDVANRGHALPHTGTPNDKAFRGVLSELDEALKQAGEAQERL